MKKAIPDHVVEQIQLMVGRKSAMQIADEFGICVTTVYNIIHRERKISAEKRQQSSIHTRKYGNLRPLTKEELTGGRASPYTR